jgi:2-phospho-L-lactate guanylyltransferase
VDVAALVPVKRFAAAKGRLADVVNDADRVRFAEWMAARVLDAVAEMPTFVACDDPGVGDWAERRGATVIWGAGLGLNGAVDDGVRQIGERGFDHILVSHADLPRPAPLARLASPGRTVLVPDRRRDGTNVMSFPTAAPILAEYGAGSFARHLSQAQRLVGMAIELRVDRDLSLDIDTPRDLRHPLIKEVLPSWLQTNPDNRRSR